MTREAIILSGTAISLGFFHTILGPDHYIPFIVLSKARKWNAKKTAFITFLCGIGHVLSSVILGFIGIALGVALFKLKSIESFRGEISSWFLIIFGFTYFIWGIRRAIRGKPHSHPHYHENGKVHFHSHKHFGDHMHIHEQKSDTLTPWILFLIFVFGPCEPLIPLVMYPSAKGNFLEVILVTSLFGLVTIGTMLSIVLASYYGLSKIPFRAFEGYSHALAGLTIFLCGGAIKFFGL